VVHSTAVAAVAVAVVAAIVLTTIRAIAAVEAVVGQVLRILPQLYQVEAVILYRSVRADQLGDSMPAVAVPAPVTWAVWPVWLQPPLAVVIQVELVALENLAVSLASPVAQA
jgi:hypothetical protein